ncbi:DUF3039 domain-containing protein [Nocardia sp. NPDC058658]|uniref:DUF3039 domain-containing protein n=1 Tax=Nocardia sp. NPDC058658 TaxID=3346580 RepID=UPI003665C974
MDANRRARPTVRLLAEDLPSGWADPRIFRAVNEGRWNDLHPLGELPHPLLRKAAQLYGDDPQDDPPPRIIACSGSLKLQELRNAQWRAGIWTDPESGVRWVCVAGLAKGGHRDGDDFYEKLNALVERSGGSELRPTDADRRLLRRETAAWAITAWELRLQATVGEVLESVVGGGIARFDAPHPARSESMGEIELTVVSGDCEEFVLVVDLDARFAASSLGWSLITRVLVSISPPTQDWDRFERSFATSAEGGFARHRAAQLRLAAERGELLPPEFGTVSHFVHSEHLAAATVEGNATRALCGVFFVPMQDHERLPTCPECTVRFAVLPK